MSGMPEPAGAATLRRAVMDEQDALQPLFDAALPESAPGAWIRDAIERMRAEGAIEGMQS
jgi:hypothetical protein